MKYSSSLRIVKPNTEALSSESVREKHQPLRELLTQPATLSAPNPLIKDSNAPPPAAIAAPATALVRMTT
jgi:hypothetical protein